MQTRSQGRSNLHPFTDEITQLQRQLRGARRRILTDTMENENRDNEDGPPAEEVQNANIPPPPQRQGRPIRAGDAPRAHTLAHGIAAPPVHANNFEIKGTTLTLVQNQKFHGLSVENPFKHLDDFELICNLTKLNGVSDDAYKLRLFPFSLGSRAQEWASRLAPGSITTWAACKDAFVAKFFPITKTAQLRTQISSFTQKNAESFLEAWERFRDYITLCPHHNLSDASLLSTFYRGVLPRFRLHLDTASNGSFLNRDVASGWELLENMATADGTYGEDFDRNHRGSSEPSSVNQRQLDSLNAKLDKLLSVSTKHVHMATTETPADYDDDAGTSEELCYMQNQGNYQGNFRQQGNYNQFRPNNNLSYRSNNVANPQDQVYPSNNQQQPPRPFIPRQPFNNFNNFKNAQNTPPGYQQQQAPPSSMSPDVTALLQQLTQNLSANTQAILKLQNEFNASRQDINNRFEQINSRLATLESNQASSSTRSTGQLPGKSIQNPKEFNVSAITIVKNEDFIDAPEDDIIPEDSNVLGGEASLTAQNTINNAEAMAHLAPTAPTLPPEELIMPTFAYSIAPPIYNTRRLDDYTILPHKLLRQFESNPAPQKLGDPGAITVPCSIKHISFPRCICDSGAAISVMPLSVADRLGIFTYKTCDYSLLLADRTLRTPYGILENVPLRIRGVEVPTDFVVLETDREPKDPILLGRPFLASTKALIDMAGESIELNLGGNNFFKFRINEEAQPPPARAFDAPLKKHRANNHQTVTLEPSAPRGDTPTYRVTCGRKPTPYEMISHLRPLHLLPLASSGPFAIKELKRDGSVTLSVPPGANIPFIGQGVSLCLTDIERNARPLSKPFI